VLSCSLATAENEYEWKDDKWVPVPGDLALIRQYVEQNRPRKAVKAARKFLAGYPDSPAREEVLHLAGQAEMNRGRYYKAYEWLEKQLADHPAGELSEGALRREFQIADAFLMGKKRIFAWFIPLSAEAEGLEILSRITEHVPGSVIAENALLRIAEHHYARKEYAEAVDAYDHHLELFGKSPRAAEAMLQAARATYASFKGIAFDETPLIEAQQRFEILAERFGRTARKANVAAILRQIIETRANKTYADGRFYERTGRAKAAAFYYRQVIDRYPKTQWAPKARQELKRLKNVRPQPVETAEEAVARLRRLFPQKEPATKPSKAKTLSPTSREGRMKK